MNTMLHLFLHKQISDLHFIKREDKIKTIARSGGEMKPIASKAFHLAFFDYLKFISGFDLYNFQQPQSSSFQYEYENHTYTFRFSTLFSLGVETAVLRLLYHNRLLKIEELTTDVDIQKKMKHWCQKRNGLILLSGPTGTGKTTTLHALLSYIYAMKHAKIMTMEEPIEIRNPNFLQFQIQDANEFGMDQILMHILRHDPDVIMVGEIRSKKQAEMLLESAFTGHLVFTTIHAASAPEVIQRLYHLGIKKEDLLENLVAVVNQRLYHHTTHGKKEVVFEILEGMNLFQYIKDGSLDYHRSLKEEIQRAIREGRICWDEAKQDL